jgi:hypothetical protein
MIPRDIDGKRFVQLSVILSIYTRVQHEMSEAFNLVLLGIYAPSNTSRMGSRGHPQHIRSIPARKSKTRLAMINGRNARPFDRTLQHSIQVPMLAYYHW